MSAFNAWILRVSRIPWLPCILLLGLGLRLFRLGAWEIGLDEAYSANVAAREIVDLVKFAALDDSHPPLYHLFLHFWRLLGTSEGWLRLPSVAFSGLAIWVLYKLGATLVQKQVGLIAALILALSPLHIFHAQDVRSYSLLYLLGITSLYFFVRIFRGGGRFDWYAYVAATALALYTHYAAFLVIGSENLAFVILLLLKQRPVPLRSWVGAQAVILLSFSPWAVVFAATISTTAPVALEHGLMPSSVQQFAFVLSSLTSHFLPMGTPLLKAIVAGVFGLAALLGALTLGPKSAAAVILLSSSLAALAATALLVGSHAIPMGTMLFIPRALITTSAGYYILIAAAIARLRPRVLAMSFLGLLLALNLYSLPRMYIGESRSGPWREVAQYVATNTQPGDGIVFVSGFWARAFDFYFMPYSITAPFIRYGSPDQLAQLEGLVKSSRRVWLVLKQPRAIDPKGRVRTFISSRGNLQVEKEFWFGIRVELYALR